MRVSAGRHTATTVVIVYTGRSTRRSSQPPPFPVVNYMTPIESILTLQRTLCHAASSSKKRTFEVLAELIASGTEDLRTDELFELLVARERLGSTGIGAGIAIPHCRCRGLGSTVGALMTLATPVQFDSVDGQPVDLVFAMLVPENAEAQHLQTLAALAEALQKPEFVDALRQARNREELYQVAINAPV